MKAHAPTEEKSDNSKDSFYEELEKVFNHYTNNLRKILFWDFNTKLGREDIFRPTTGNESLHQDNNNNNNNNGVKIVNLAIPKKSS
jgi:hypothetical protein